MDNEILLKSIESELNSCIESAVIKDMVTVEVMPDKVVTISQQLKDQPQWGFDCLIDICGVDYIDYGCSQWRTEETTMTGYSRGVAENQQNTQWTKPRYAVVYHLLSIQHNHRLRFKTFLSPEPQVASVIDIWPAANWFEREAFDLFGIVFDGHPDLRRILTDYGFKGHPFRKDYPLIGEVELRYDAKKQRCVYEPVSINERVLVPKTIRDDSRYLDPTKQGQSDG